MSKTVPSVGAHTELPKITKGEWKKRYKAQLIKTAGITKKFAEEVYQAGTEDHDFNDDPEDAALMELSYWNDQPRLRGEKLLKGVFVLLGANMKCRHYHTWLIAGGLFEWCYECGALRKMIEIAPAYLRNCTQWTRPTGKGGKNPYPMKALNPSPAPERGKK